MLIFDIFTVLFFLSFFGVLWGFVFFLFDAQILKGYFKKKLQQRFNIDDVK